MKDREEYLLPIYHTVAVNFADLHDRAGRMQEKQVISVSTAELVNNHNNSNTKHLYRSILRSALYRRREQKEKNE